MLGVMPAATDSILCAAASSCCTPWSHLVGPVHPPGTHQQRQVVEELGALGVAPAAIDSILSALSLRSVEQLEAALGHENEAVADLRKWAWGCW